MDRGLESRLWTKSAPDDNLFPEGRKCSKPLCSLLVRPIGVDRTRHIGTETNVEPKIRDVMKGTSEDPGRG
jgi:hypothetical protein